MRKRLFEHRDAPLAPQQVFFSRLALSTLASLALVATTLAIGMIGFHWIENLGWLDAFHHAAMLLAGMGPIHTMMTATGKLFDGFYALFCGIILLAATAVLFAPLVHRLLHRFHLEDADR